MKILIIDDHQLFNDGLKSLLLNEPIFEQIYQLYENRETLKHIHLHQPDIILLDFNMPNANGLEISTQIIKNFPLQKIIILSMYAESSQILQFEKIGAKGYLLKTVDSSTLIAGIIEVFNGGVCFPIKIKENNHSNDGFAKKFKLTNREINVIKLIKEGKSNNEMAKILHLSIHTIVTHRKNIHIKLSIQNERELIKFATENGI